MGDKSSFQLRSREGSMSSSIALEAQRIVRNAATPVQPGQTVKAQLRRAARALGYPDGDWRVRAAWYSEAACWSAAAFEDLRTRHAAWQASNEAKANASKKLAHARFTSIRDALAAIDADFHRDEITRLEYILGQLGR